MFSKLFGGSQPAPSEAPAPSEGPADTSAQASQVASQPMHQPADGQPGGQAPQATAPKGLDLLNTIMQNESKQQAAPAFQIPPDKMGEIAGSLDFTGGIPQEAMAKLASGDLSALPDILNAVGRQAYTTALDHSMRVTDKHLGDRLKSHEASMSDNNRKQLVTSQLSLEDMHPMAQAMFKDVSAKLASQFPDATPKDIEAQAWVMMEELGSQFNRTQKLQQRKLAAAETDWDKAAGFSS